MSEPCCMADAHGQACTCRERLYTQAELNAAVRAAYEDAAKVADEMEEGALAIMNEGYPFPDEYWPSCVAAAIRERGE